MALRTEWAYDFSCDQTLEAICRIFNETGPWQWQMRENYIFGSYLNTRPAEGLHLQVHEYPQAFISGLREEGFKALLRMEIHSPYSREEVDPVFRALLRKIGAEDLTEIETYD